MAIWGVRLMGPGLVLLAGGLVSLLWSTATGKAVLAAGIGLYLIGMATMLVGSSACPASSSRRSLTGRGPRRLCCTTHCTPGRRSASAQGCKLAASA
jgi:hypothetical protein